MEMLNVRTSHPPMLSGPHGCGRPAGHRWVVVGAIQGSRYDLDVSTRRAPCLLLVSGEPGSGKTSLSLALAAATGMYRVSKAEIARALDVTDHEDPSNHACAWATYWTVLEALVNAGVSVIADQTTWRGQCDVIIRARLMPRALVRNVHCRTAAAERRWLDHLSRAGERSAVDVAALRDRMRPRRAQFVEPLELGQPLLCIDTTDGYLPGLEDIVAFACARGD